MYNNIAAFIFYIILPTSKQLSFKNNKAADIQQLC